MAPAADRPRGINALPKDLNAGDGLPLCKCCQTYAPKHATVKLSGVMTTMEDENAEYSNGHLYWPIH